MGRTPGLTEHTRYIWSKPKTQKIQCILMYRYRTGGVGAEKMVQQLRVLIALPEDTHLVLHKLTKAHTQINK